MPRYRFKPIEIVFTNLRRYYGWAKAETRTIWIDPRLGDRKTLEIACHETLHVEFPFVDEINVKRAGKSMGDVLWRMGFRRMEKGDE